MVQVATPEAEGAQALFCYIADVLGAKTANKEFQTYLDPKSQKDFTTFQTEYKDIINEAFSGTREVNIDKPKDAVIRYLKNNPAWFKSSLVIAKELLNELSNVSSKLSGKINPPRWGNIFYVRGDNEVMGTLSELFKSANKQSEKEKGSKSFGDINKWSPADIYFATNKAKTTLKDKQKDPETKKNNLTFAELNECVGGLIESGDLLPLSLKKAEGSIKIVKVNFKRKDEEKLLAKTISTGVQKWQPMKGAYKMTAKSGKKNAMWDFTKPYSGGRDIYLLLSSEGKKGRIQIRHTPASGGKPQKGVKVILSYPGSSALGGQVVGIPLFTKLIRQVDSAFATKISQTWDNNYKIFEREANNYIKFGKGGKLYATKTKEAQNQFNDDMGAISGLTVMNAIRPELDKYFSKKGKKQDNVMRAIFAYVSSRSIDSSPFVIAKD
tara:strand:+ start:53 stop:1369 length:1317 start_codon:yes stop_codon:yes gene_type:complete